MNNREVLPSPHKLCIAERDLKVEMIWKSKVTKRIWQKIRQLYLKARPRRQRCYFDLTFMLFNVFNRNSMEPGGKSYIYWKTASRQNPQNVTIEGRSQQNINGEGGSPQNVTGEGGSP